MMNQDEQGCAEQISALVDGQLGGGAFARTVGAIGASGEALATWHAYHVIGDVLRSGDLTACGNDGVFLERLRARLAVEAGHASKPALPLREPAAAPPVVASVHAGPVVAANDGSRRWKLVALAACVAAIGAITWQVVLPTAVPAPALATAPAAPPVVADAAPPLATGAEAQVMLRDPRLDELLAAHKQSGAVSALQMPAGFLRNATFDASGR